MVWYSHLFENFPQFSVIHTVKAFGIVNKADIDVFLERSCFFDDPADVGNLISGSPSFSITSWQIGGETTEKVRGFIFLGSKITADGDCSHEIQRHLGRKAITNLDSILKSKSIAMPIKVHIVKAMVFPN